MVYEFSVNIFSFMKIPDLVLLITVHVVKMYRTSDVFKLIAEIMQSKFKFFEGFFFHFYALLSAFSFNEISPRKYLKIFSILRHCSVSCLFHLLF